MYFHETIRATLEVMLACGETVDHDTAIVRDASGRITVARSIFVNAAELKEKLRGKLGSYASDLVVMEGVLTSALLKSPKSFRKNITLSRPEMELIYTYVDNRVVGEDWLSVDTAPASEVAAKRLTFYSLKGGVGRSTALSIYAAHLATQGKKSLVIDLDIEAPGLGNILLSNGKASHSNLPRFGVIDYLLENGIGGIDRNSLSDFLATSAFGNGMIDVVPAIGYETEIRPSIFVEKLSRALTEDFVSGEKRSLSRQVRDMVDAFDQFSVYDVILIDARAGFAEVSAAALTNLDSQLVLFGVDQSQTISGYRYLLSHLIEQTDFSKGPPRWRERITFVQAKAPGTRRERSSFKADLFEICAETIYDQFEDGDEDEKTFTFAPLDESTAAPHNAAYIRFDSAFSGFDPLRHDEQLDAELFKGAYANFIKRIDEIVFDGDIQ